MPRCALAIATMLCCLLAAGARAGAPFSVTLQFEDLSGGVPQSTTSLVFGISASSTNGFDAGQDVLAPPSAPDASGAFFLSGLTSPLDRFSSDFRGDVMTGGSVQWRLVLSIADQRTGRLTWPGGFPPDLSALALIETDGAGTPLPMAIEQSLFTAGSLTTNAGIETRHFRVSATRSIGTPTPTPTPTPCPPISSDPTDTDGDGFTDAVENTSGGNAKNPAIQPDFGDADASGATNLADAITMTRRLTNATLPHDCSLDANNDGAIDQLDALALWRWATGREAVLPTQ